MLKINNIQTIRNIYRTSNLPNSIRITHCNGADFSVVTNNRIYHFGDNIDRHRFDLLKEAFVESDQPFAVDIHCWSLIPESFHQQIKTNYIALYSPTQPPNSANDSPEKTVQALSEICSLITVGATSLVTHADLPATPHNHVALLRPNPQKVLPHFLLSVLNSNAHQARIQTISRALPHTPYSD